MEICYYSKTILLLSFPMCIHFGKKVSFYIYLSIFFKSCKSRIRHDFTEMIKFPNTLNLGDSNQTILLSEKDKEVEDMDEVSSLSSEVSSMRRVWGLAWSGEVPGWPLEN